MKQITLKNSFSLKGVGLHTGANINITFHPAPVNTGYIIKRVDLDGQPEIKALAENVKDTKRGTVLSKDSVQVSTIEHGMATLYGFQIDNCLIEVDAPEFPIFDGGSTEYVKAIEEVGTIEQEEEKDYFIVRKKIEVSDAQTGAKLILIPDDNFAVNVSIDFHSDFLPAQSASLESLSEFKTEISPARTFVFVREIEQLFKSGLIQGGSLDNAIVIYDQKTDQKTMDNLADVIGVEHRDASQLGYLNKHPLKFSNEPARHKLLDVIGDIALIGRPLKGRIIAIKPGHKINNMLAKAVRKIIRLQGMQAPVYDASQPPILDTNQIKQYLPHRFPFLLVDKIIKKTDKYIVGIKNVTGNEHFFVGHFPEEPVMPGVLQIEAASQVGGLLVLTGLDNPSSYSTYFLKIDNVKFRQKVVPGDTLIIRADLTSPIRRGIANMKAVIFVGEQVVSEVQFTAQVIQNK